LQASACAASHVGFQGEEGFEAMVSEGWAGALAEGARGICELVAEAAGKIGVMEIQFDGWTPAIANECWAGISEAGFDPFQAECLNSAGVVEFHEMGCETKAG
jgi:glycine cleavage system aminomethyltransferase T